MKNIFSLLFMFIFLLNQNIVFGIRFQDISHTINAIPPVMLAVRDVVSSTAKLTTNLFKFNLQAISTAMPIIMMMSGLSILRKNVLFGSIFLASSAFLYRKEKKSLEEEKQAEIKKINENKESEKQAEIKKINEIKESEKQAEIEKIKAEQEKQTNRKVEDIRDLYINTQINNEKEIQRLNDQIKNIETTKVKAYQAHHQANVDRINELIGKSEIYDKALDLLIPKNKKIFLSLVRFLNPNNPDSKLFLPRAVLTRGVNLFSKYQKI